MSEKFEQDVSGPQAALTPSTPSAAPAAAAQSADLEALSSQESGQGEQSEDAEQAALHSLYKKAVHLTDPEPEYHPDQPIAKMTHHELKAMRSKSVVVEAKVPFKETFANSVIKSFDEFLQSFKKTAEPRRLKCLDTGHECIHCGKKFEIEDKTKSKSKKRD